MIGYFQQMAKIFGAYPRYTVGMSCDGPDTYYPGYDYVAASKTVMEVFCRYLATHFLGTDVRINVLRSRPVSTDSLRATFGEGFEPFLRRYHGDAYFIEAEQVADAVLALCSGLLDGVSGQVILLDKGVGFCDNLMWLYEERDRYGL
jgi:enoyl-[acyl-carrier-protein] reductase (NADH)